MMIQNINEVLLQLRVINNNKKILRCAKKKIKSFFVIIKNKKLYTRNLILIQQRI